MALKEISQKQLAEILRKHSLWLGNKLRNEDLKDGERAVLDGSNLEELNLNDASLNYASLDGASLNGASLNGASLDRASLNDASLNDASLNGASLNYASLDRASLNRASLNRASLINANLINANLNGASLINANLNYASLDRASLNGASLNRASLNYASLNRASLNRASLNGASLNDASLNYAKLPDFQLCPEGNFTAWKKVNSPKGSVILKLSILGERTSSLVGRKCRTSKAEVVSAFSLETGKKVTGVFTSHYDKSFIYQAGKTASVKDYDSDIRVECTKGIHFFITRKEAEEYDS